MSPARKPAPVASFIANVAENVNSVSSGVLLVHFLAERMREPRGVPGIAGMLDFIVGGLQAELNAIEYTVEQLAKESGEPLPPGWLSGTGGAA